MHQSMHEMAGRICHSHSWGGSLRTNETATLDECRPNREDATSFRVRFRSTLGLRGTQTRYEKLLISEVRPCNSLRYADVEEAIHVTLRGWDSWQWDQESRESFNERLSWFPQPDSRGRPPRPNQIRGTPSWTELASGPAGPPRTEGVRVAKKINLVILLKNKLMLVKLYTTTSICIDFLFRERIFPASCSFYGSFTFRSGGIRPRKNLGASPNQLGTRVAPVKARASGRCPCGLLLEAEAKTGHGTLKEALFRMEVRFRNAFALLGAQHFFYRGKRCFQPEGLRHWPATPTGSALRSWRNHPRE